MGDEDIGEMFLNFFMDKAICPFSGVDLTQFVDEEGGSALSWYRWVRYDFGFRPSPFVDVQTMAWLEETIKGDRSDPSDVFRCDGVRLNLPGSSTYDPAKPWVFNFTSSDGTIAAGYMLYIEDSRPTGPTLDEYRKSQRKFSATCNHHGIQDAARKQRPPSLTPRAWAGYVVHINSGEFSVIVTQERWDKT
jgi:hypothetical protein